jgi:hypothetical protein
VALLYKEHRLQVEKGRRSFPCAHGTSERSELRRQAPETDLDLLAVLDVHINRRQGFADLADLQGVIGHRQIALS